LEQKKSHLINCIKERIATLVGSTPSPIILLAPIGVTTLNIQASTICVSLHLPIKDLMPLEENVLATFQKELKHI